MTASDTQASNGEATDDAGGCRKVPFSFELFPPRTPEGGLELAATVDALAAVGPEFLSVTYGAQGSSRTASLALAKHLLAYTHIRPLAHLTCVGTTPAQARRLVEEFLDAGILDFLAVRGDPPKGQPDTGPAPGDLQSAGELVQLIHRIQTERDQFSPVPENSPTRPGHNPQQNVRIAVAAFPGGHPASRSTQQDIDTLLAKEAAGADFAITQLFFHADDYLSLVADARAQGLTIPILPGLLPATSTARLTKVAELSGQRAPADLFDRLAREEDPTTRQQLGVEWTVELVRAIVDGGAPGVHLYTFNRPEASLDVLRQSGLLSLVPA